MVLLCMSSDSGTVIHSFFSSIKLAIVLILYISAASVIATLVPQHRESVFYFHRYSPVIARLLLFTGFTHFFTSILFLAPATLFFCNLGVCTVTRLAKEIKKTIPRRYGPDLIHVGVLILIIGAVISFGTKREGLVYLAEGERALLPGGYTVTVESFEFQTYDDGRPKDWISTVDVHKDKSLVIDSRKIEVNRPLKVEKIKIYQSSYAEETRVDVVKSPKEFATLREGRMFQVENATYLFKGFEKGSQMKVALLEKWEDHRALEILKLQEGDSFNSGQSGETFSVRNFRSVDVTGLMAKVDRGFPTVLIGMIIAGVGLSLTYIRKAKDSV